MKVKCKCELCGKEIEVEFVIPPTRIQMRGWVCKPCGKEIKEEEK